MLRCVLGAKKLGKMVMESFSDHVGMEEGKVKGEVVPVLN
jgi:hypothetical protein